MDELRPLGCAVCGAPLGDPDHTYVGADDTDKEPEDIEVRLLCERCRPPGFLAAWDGLLDFETPDPHRPPEIVPE